MEMAYSNRFAVCVLVDGRIMKELRDGSVGVPFGSEYNLRLFNKHDRRAVAKISIDGENVSGNGFIIPPHDKIEINRPVYRDAAFRFVELGSDAALEEGKPTTNEDREMGLIEVRFHLEQEKPKPKVVEHHHHHYPPKYRGPWWGGVTLTSAGGGGTYTSSMPPGDHKSILRSCHAPADEKTLGFPEATPQDVSDGCTVEGRATGTSYGTAYIDIESTSTLIKLFLQGFRSGTQVNTVE